MRAEKIVEALESTAEQAALLRAVAQHIPARPVIQHLVTRHLEAIDAGDYAATHDAELFAAALQEALRDLRTRIRIKVNIEPSEFERLDAE